MFRPMLKASLRSGAFSASRRLSTVRPVRGSPKVKLAGFAGFAVLASAFIFTPRDALSNDTNQEKVEFEQKLAEDFLEAEKTGFELVEAAKETLEQTAEALVSEETAEVVKATLEGKITKTKNSENKEETEEHEKSEGSETPESEERGSQAAAFNPETGEINWDCPCLGGMAHGPCGEEFKAAFSCFVYSETEPQGIDCIGKFEAMRTCFRQHPEHYKEELYEDSEPVPSTESSEFDSSSHAEIDDSANRPKPAEHSKPAQTLRESNEKSSEPATEDISKVA